MKTTTRGHGLRQVLLLSFAGIAVTLLAMAYSSCERAEVPVEATP
jgi:hypothetical protein